MANLFIALYTSDEEGRAKSYLVYGDGTKEHKEKIKSLGGKFIKNFTHPVPEGVTCGWIISASKKELADRLCAAPESFTEERTPKKKAAKRVAKTAKMASPLEIIANLGLSAEQVQKLMAMIR